MKIHMCVDIRGSLRNGSYRNGGFRHPDGRTMTDNEAFDALCDELAKGHELLPMGGCDNFDFKTGCRGHDDSAAGKDGERGCAY